MMALIINDLHLNCQRTGGTTPQTQQALKDYLRERFKFLLGLEQGAVICNGDFFDGFSVDPSELIKAYQIIADWLHDNPEAMFYNIQGNHDWHASGTKVSAWHLLNHFLTSHFGDRVRVFDTGLEHVVDSIYCIPHVANTALFELEIDKACAMDGKGKFLLLHCNVKNKFCDEKDHSLGITDEQLGNLMRAGWHCVVGHEHVGYTLRGGRVIVVGNQTSASVSDCIGDQTKEALRITGDAFELIETQRTSDIYVETDWQHLDVGTAKFIRVVGDATAAQAADVINVISKLRQSSDAFVITNAVKIEGVVGVDDAMNQSIEAVGNYDVVAEILKELTPEEGEIVKGLLNAQ